MARCGCTATDTCNCAVEAGNGVSVTGSGTPGNPYVVAIDTIDCDQVRPCISAGQGASYNPVSGIVAARISPQAGNQIQFAPDGGLYADTDCPTVRACFAEGDGIDYNPLTGIIAARPSTDPGNNVSFGGDGGLYAPGTSTVSTECGLSGDGSPGSPLAVAVGAWPYACDLETLGGVVACGDDGVLRSEPRGRVQFTSFTEERNYADIVVPAGFDQPGDSFVTNVVNNDLCRSALVYVEREADVDFNLPAGAGAAYGHATDEVYYTRNNGPTTILDAHAQTTKVFALGALLAPGAAIPITFDVTVGRGSAGATYNRIQISIRVLLISL